MNSCWDDGSDFWITLELGTKVNGSASHYMPPVQMPPHIWPSADVRQICTSTPLVPRTENSGRNTWISRLMRPRLYASPSHQQWLCRTYEGLSSTKKYFNYLCHLNVANWKKCLCILYNCVSSKKENNCKWGVQYGSGTHFALSFARMEITNPKLNAIINEIFKQFTVDTCCSFHNTGFRWAFTNRV